MQSNYMPWKGYYDIIHDVDVFVYYDEVQYTKNDWRNRNKIYTPNGVKWITLPCGYDIHRNISEIKLKNELNWQTTHYNLIKNSYEKAPFWNKYSDFIEYVYLERKWEYLYELNRYCIETISKNILGIKTVFCDSRDYPTTGFKSEKLLDLLIKVGTNIYVSGPAAKSYIQQEEYTKAGIDIVWKNYDNYPPYKQQYTPNFYDLSILDLIFNTGEEAPYYIWGWRDYGKKVDSDS